MTVTVRLPARGNSVTITVRLPVSEKLSQGGATVSGNSVSVTVRLPARGHSATVTVRLPASGISVGLRS